MSWVNLDTAWVRLRDVSAFDLDGEKGPLLVYMRSGLTLRFPRDFYHEVHDAFAGIAEAERKARAEHGVYE